jgi:hypothetical protein
MAPLNDQQRRDIEKELFANRKVAAIKFYREATDLGLADSARAVEEMDKELRQQQPRNFAATKDGSPMLRVAITLLIILAITAFVIFKLFHK